MNSSKFTHINEAFTCLACGRAVPPRATSCRNHCPYCLTSLHVDINPGDRANECQGLMDAIGYEMDGKKGLVLRFKCRRCGALTRNVAAREDPIASDDLDAVLRLR